MPKKPFLIPVAVAVTALISATQSAVASAPSEPTRIVEQNALTPTGDLVLDRAINPVVHLAQHDSHSSHESHDSHSSHESHSSHSSGGF